MKKIFGVFFLLLGLSSMAYAELSPEDEKEALKILEEKRKEMSKAEEMAKKEAERKAKEAEKMRRSEEFRTGQKIVNTETATPTSTGGKTTDSTTKLSKGEKLLDEVLQSKIKKGLNNYLDYINKNKNYTEAYPLVLVNYKEINQYSSSELAKISKINSTTFFKKGSKRTEDFKENGKNGVVIIKVEF